MHDTTVWLIALGFYAPLHYLGPGLVALLTGRENPAQRKRLLILLAADCTLSMALAFAVAVWLFPSRPQLAMTILLLSMLAPYLHVAAARWRQRHVTTS
jgi:hypothetical protein